MLSPGGCAPTKTKICLVSQDTALRGVCREVLYSLPDHCWELVKHSSWDPGLEADVWILDCATKFPPESWLRNHEDKIIFIVDRNGLVSFRDLLPGEAVRIALKPVQLYLLRAFLEQLAPPTPNGQNDIPDASIGRIKLERDLILQHLLEANLALQKYDQERTGFLARLGYDLLAPLVAITGYCGLLRDRRLGPLNAEQSDALARVEHSARRITRLTNSLMQLGIGEQLPFDAVMKVGDIQVQIRRAMTEVGPVAESKDLKFNAELNPPSRPLLFEACQIEQVLVSLLDSACRMTPRGGTVTVKALPTFWDRRSTHVVEFPLEERRRLPDEQKGMAQIPEPNSYRIEIQISGGEVCFNRHEPASDFVHNGAFRTDLGLAACRHIVSAHRGQLLIDDNSSGASCAIVLPFAPARKPAQAAALFRQARTAS